MRYENEFSGVYNKGLLFLVILLAPTNLLCSGAFKTESEIRISDIGFQNMLRFVECNILYDSIYRNQRKRKKPIKLNWK